MTTTRATLVDSSSGWPVSAGPTSAAPAADAAAHPDKSSLADSLTPAANARDATQARALLHRAETTAWTDAGYQEVEKRPEHREARVESRLGGIAAMEPSPAGSGMNTRRAVPGALRGRRAATSAAAFAGSTPLAGGAVRSPKHSGPAGQDGGAPSGRGSRAGEGRNGRRSGAPSSRSGILRLLPARAGSLAAPLALLLVALAYAVPAAGQTSVELVGNDGQTSTNTHAGTFQNNYATSFTTGGSREGYVLTRSDLFSNELAAILGDKLDAHIYTDASGIPGTWLGFGTANNTADLNAFSRAQISLYDDALRTAPAGINLDPNTKYWLVVIPTLSTGSAAQILLGGTSSDAEDSGGFPWWSIGNHRLVRAKGSGSSWTTTSTNTNALRMNLVGHANDSPAPVVRSARVSSNGRTVTLYYNEALDPASVPAASTFAVNYGGTDKTPSAVTVSGSTVALTLNVAVTASQTVAVTYDAASATSPIRDMARVKAAALSGLPVTNDRGATVPTVSSTAFTSTPTHDTDTTPDGVNDTYGVGAQIKVKVTFSEAVTVDTSRGTPRLKLKLHANQAEKWALYESGSGTTALTFAYTVASGDSSSNGSTDAGIRVPANSIVLTGGTIRSASSSKDANLTHAVLGPSSTQKVNGSLDSQPPRFKEALTTGRVLNVDFDKNLDNTSQPATSDFELTATSPNGSVRSVNVSALTFQQGQLARMLLTIAGVRHGEVVTLSYTKPSSNPLKGANGYAVASFSGKPVTNSTLALHAPPSVTAAAGSTSGTLSVNWTSPESLGLTPTGYDLRYYAGTEDPPAGREADWIEDAPGLPDPGAAATSATIKGLEANTAYRVQVRGKTSTQNGPWSASGSATTAAAPASNNAPRSLALQTANAQGNICFVLSNPLTTTRASNASTDTLHSRFPLVSRGTETTELPSSCSATSPVQPVFDDKDGDTLTVTAEVRDLPANVRLAPDIPSVVQPTTGASGRVWFRGTAAFKRTRVYVYMTATDVHGASVTTRYGFNVAAGSDASAPSFGSTVPDQTASTSREFSLVLPAATGGDLGNGDGQVFPYFYQLTGLPKGLIFDEETLTISGTPLETGTFTVTYTADDADQEGSAYLNPATTDTTDVASDSFTITVASTPHVDMVRVVSAPTHDANGDGKNDTYGAGDKIVIDVEYSEPVKVNVPVGSGNGVRLRLDLGPDDDTLSNSRKTADLTGVHHGGKTLRFEYTVVAADLDPDGVWVQTHETTGQMLFVRGTATIKGLATGTAADLNASGLVTGGTLDGDGLPLTYVNGRVSAAGPTPVSGTVNSTSVALRFNEALAVMSADELEALTLNFGVQGVDTTGGNRNAWHHPTEVGHHPLNNDRLYMTLGVAARPGDVVTLSYQRIDYKGAIKDTDGNMAPGFVDFELTNDTDGTTGPKPLKATVEGTTLEIVFDGELSTSSTVTGDSFTVQASDSDYDHRTIAGTGTATVSGTKVTVTLAEAVEPNETAQVSLKASSGLQSDGGVAVPSFNGFKIETVKDDAVPELVDGGAVQTRAVPAQTEVALYFSETLHRNYVPDTGAFSVTVAAAAAVNPSAVAIDGNAVTLTVAKAAADGDTVRVVYTVPTDAAKKIQDLAGNAAAEIDTNDADKRGKLTGGLVASGAGTPVVVISNTPGVDETLVSNTGQASGGSSDLSFDFAQAFTTGSVSAGYKLTSVTVRTLRRPRARRARTR